MSAQDQQDKEALPGGSETAQDAEQRNKPRRSRSQSVRTDPFGAASTAAEALMNNAAFQTAHNLNLEIMHQVGMDAAIQAATSQFDVISSITERIEHAFFSQAAVDAASHLQLPDVTAALARELIIDNPLLAAAEQVRPTLLSAQAIETMDRVEEIWRTMASNLESVSDLASLEDWHRSLLGKRGALAYTLQDIKDVPVEDRPKIGKYSNKVKAAVQEIYDALFEKAEQTELERRLARDGVDVTLPGRAPLIGTAHPVSQMIAELSEIFALMGFQTVFGPEVETERYSFDLLNIPSDHPARDVWDTFHVEPEGGGVVLRPHTSPMQARVMEATAPPVRVVVPGRTYRYEAQDASHEWMFHQLEGLAVDERITMADLKGTLAELARQLFGPERRVRFRCDFFPFVEPGVDFAVDCAVCGGRGCRVCKQSGWLEMGGAGMVHPNVLAGVGYDPAEVSGFAFGLGVERMLMMRYGVDDVRAFAGNDLRFLRQFARPILSAA